jgi:initiation factor 1A
MPPNKKGGKGYKKGKHSGEQEAQMLEWDEAAGQMPGRVLKKLGDRRFRVYCNDNKERICKLCGTMRKSDWVDEGALVILGTRELGNVRQEDNKKELLIGDILALVDPSLYGKFKKIPFINQLLFTSVEGQDIQTIMKKLEKAKAENKTAANDEDDCGIEFTRNGDSDGNEDEWDDSKSKDEDDSNLTEQEKAAKRKDKEKKRQADFNTRRDAKTSHDRDNDETINIDDI